MSAERAGLKPVAAVKPAGEPPPSKAPAVAARRSLSARVTPDPPDGFVDISDVSRMTGLFGLHC